MGRVYESYRPTGTRDTQETQLVNEITPRELANAHYAGELNWWEYQLMLAFLHNGTAYNPAQYDARLRQER